MNKKTEYALTEYIKKSDVMNTVKNVTDILKNFDIGQRQAVIKRINSRPIGPNPNFINNMKALLPNLAIGSLISQQNPVNLFNKLMEYQNG